MSRTTTKRKPRRWPCVLWGDGSLISARTIGDARSYAATAMEFLVRGERAPEVVEVVEVEPQKKATK